jgi:hypothetical protein
MKTTITSLSATAAIALVIEVEKQPGFLNGKRPPTQKKSAR